MAWRLARSLETLRNQLNTHYPKRSKVSDGTIGDTAHSKTKSDHNPRDGVVCAFDITHDPNNGPNLAQLIPLLLKDRRTKYVIFNKKIYNPTIQNGAARAYSGANAHKQHLHLSVNWDRRDEAQSWVLPGSPLITSVEAPPRQQLKRRMTGGDVSVLQLVLRKHGYYSGLVDGDFGPETEKSLKKAQIGLGLKSDGICGPLTWKALEGLPEPTSGQEQTENKPIPVPEPVKTVPQQAIAYFESLGWSHIQSVALVANLVWESGGNAKKPKTIIFDAHGDKDKEGVFRSHGAGQWNEKAGRFGLLCDFAEKRGTLWSDPDTQLAYLSHELNTTERRAGVPLRAAQTIEDAVEAAIKVWRPSIPHADKRLAIARTLLK